MGRRVRDAGHQGLDPRVPRLPDPADGQCEQSDTKTMIVIIMMREGERKKRG